MNNETTAGQPTTCGACGANEGERCRTMSDDRCDAGKHVTSQPKEPHWIDGEQSSLGGKTAREGYAANPEYAGLYPAASQPKSIGDDAQQALVRAARKMLHRIDATGNKSVGFTYSDPLIDNIRAALVALERAPAAQASAAVQAVPYADGGTLLISPDEIRVDNFNFECENELGQILLALKGWVCRRIDDSILSHSLKPWQVSVTNSRTILYHGDLITPDTVDYKALLLKYKAFVGDEEGSDFTSRINEDGTSSYSKVQFTKDELKALEGEYHV